MHGATEIEEEMGEADIETHERMISCTARAETAEKICEAEIETREGQIAQCAPRPMRRRARL